MKNPILFTALAAMIPFSAWADIDFETTAGYTGVGVYDCWEGSPFRTNTLAGNAKVVDNPDKSVDEALGTAINASEKVLGAQRSRFGSNLFGARVDLAEHIQLTTEFKYVHVMVHRPVAGRVALVGLGKRNDRDDQTGEEEQFYVVSNNNVESNKWCDAVFAIKGSSSVELYSLVVVPECESPHNSTEDFLFYIDDITVNEDVSPRFSSEFYQINYNKEATLGQVDRHLNSVTLKSSTFGSQTASINQGSTKKLYTYEPNTYFRAKAGETVSVSVDWTGFWMHSYVYIDRDNNGQFEAAVKEDGYTPEDGSDLMTFSAVEIYGNYYSSTGRIYAGDTRTMPNFTIPADLKSGVYRMRYKIDWSDIDPGGSTVSNNGIDANRGAIADIILVITDGSDITVGANQLNGNVTTETGESLNNYKAKFGEPFKVKMVPAPGFQYSGMKVRHGVLSGDSIYHDNPMYRDVVYEYDSFDSNDCFTIPAEIMDGDVLIEGYFVEDGTQPQRVTITYNLEYDGRIVATQDVTGTVGQPYPEVTWETEASDTYYTISDLPEGTVTDAETVTLTLTQNLPFETSNGHNDAHWYNLSLTSSRNYLTHNVSTSYIDLSESTTAIPAADDYNSQWAFVGNVFEGFKIINRGAGEGMVLSSSTETSVSTGGNTFPVMTAEPVPASNNTYWMPTESAYLTEYNGFYLNQLGYPANRMNSRDSRLAYWTGGVDAGSTFIATLVDTTTGIDEITIGEINSDDDVEYYNLQGIRIKAENLTPGIYIRRQNNKATKVLVK